MERRQPAGIYQTCMGCSSLSKPERGQYQLEERPSTFRQNLESDEWKNFWPMLGRKAEVKTFLVESDLVKIQSAT
jgi:hypothetical protein